VFDARPAALIITGTVAPEILAGIWQFSRSSPWRVRQKVPGAAHNKNQVTPVKLDTARFKTRSAAGFGIDAQPVDVEVDLSATAWPGTSCWSGWIYRRPRKPRTNKIRADELRVRLSQPGGHGKSGSRPRAQGRDRVDLPMALAILVSIIWPWGTLAGRGDSRRPNTVSGT